MSDRDRLRELKGSLPDAIMKYAKTGLRPDKIALEKIEQEIRAIERIGQEAF